MRLSRFCVLLLAGLAACMPEVAVEDRQRTLIVAKAFAPLSLDPGVYATGNDYPVQELVYEQLVQLDPSAPDKVAPELAEAWTVSPDGLVITLTLAKDRVFESGTPVTAEAVVFSLERVKSLGRWSASALEWLKRADSLPNGQVRLYLNRPFPGALQALAQSSASIVDPSVVATNAGSDQGIGFLSRESAGSGPYQVSEVTLDGTIVLTPNPEHPPPEYFNRIEFRVIPDEGVRRLMLERGDIDFTDIVPSALLARYRALPGVDVTLGEPGASLSYLTLNTREGPFADRTIREAAYAAIDYEGLRLNVLKANAALLPGFVPPQASGFDPGLSAPRRDLPRAQRLLAEAGYKGEPVIFLTAQVGPVAEFLQSNLSEAGFKVQIVRRDPGSIDSLKRRGEFGFVYEGWLMDSAEPDAMYESLFASWNIETGLNGSGYSDPALDGLIRALSAEADPEERVRLSREIDRRLTEARPVVMLFSALPVAAYRRGVTGLSIKPLKPYYHPFHQMRRETQPRSPEP
jgi:peptide/nickel transport system substrate-binding protein